MRSLTMILMISKMLFFFSKSLIIYWKLECKSFFYYNLFYQKNVANKELVLRLIILILAIAKFSMHRARFDCNKGCILLKFIASRRPFVTSFIVRGRRGLRRRRRRSRSSRCSWKKAKSNEMKRSQTSHDPLIRGLNTADVFCRCNIIIFSMRT